MSMRPEVGKGGKEVRNKKGKPRQVVLGVLGGQPVCSTDLGNSLLACLRESCKSLVIVNSSSQLDTSRKKEPQLRTCLHRIGLYVFVGHFLDC